jgi:hypothetical protein
MWLSYIKFMVMGPNNPGLFVIGEWDEIIIRSRELKFWLPESFGPT